MTDPAAAEKPKPEKPKADGLFKEWLKEFWRLRFADRRRHWVLVFICIFIGECLSFVLERDNSFSWLRSYVYYQYQRLDARDEAMFNSVVLIDDETYYKGKWTRRVPISRLLLAELIERVAKCAPAVIVVDIDLATGDDLTTPVKIEASGDRPAREITLHTSKEYGSETVVFLDAVQAALAKRIPVVLTHEVGRESDKAPWTRFPNVYDGYDFGQRKPRLGHLFYDEDLRLLPLPVTLADGSRVKSLAIEAVEAYKPSMWKNKKWVHHELMRHIDPDRLVTVTAHDLLNPDLDDKVCEKLQHTIVWIGGGWHRDGYKRRTITVDSHPSPSGPLPGVLLHANYAESLLDLKQLGIGSTLLAEVPLALLIAFLFDWAKWPWKWFVMLLAIFFPLALTYVGVKNFGLYFDVTVIVFLLIFDVLAETVYGWYEDHVELLKIKGAPAH